MFKHHHQRLPWWSLSFYWTAFNPFYSQDTSQLSQLLKERESHYKVCVMWVRVLSSNRVCQLTFLFLLSAVYVRWQGVRTSFSEEIFFKNCHQVTLKVYVNGVSHLQTEDKGKRKISFTAWFQKGIFVCSSVRTASRLRLSCSRRRAISLCWSRAFCAAEVGGGGACCGAGGACGEWVGGVEAWGVGASGDCCSWLRRVSPCTRRDCSTVSSSSRLLERKKWEWRSCSLIT